jgi:hypothetical protein
MVNWIKNLFKPREVNIWKDVKCEYLRNEMDYGICPEDMHDMYVYAITQFCLNTGKTRIYEKWDFFKMEEFDILEETRKKNYKKEIET